MAKVAIWLDDERNPNNPLWGALISKHSPDAEEIVWCKNYKQFLSEFTRIREDSEMDLVAVFFDNDLGGKKQGNHAFTWMENQVRLHELGPFTLYAQTANTPARLELQGGFESLKRFWGI